MTNQITSHLRTKLKMFIINKACIAVNDAIQGRSQERLYHQLGLESLGDRIL